MDTKTMLKAGGAVIVYKIQDKYFPISLPAFGMDLAKAGLGVVELLLANYGEKKFTGTTKDITDVLGYSGAFQVVSELLKLVPSAPAAPSAGAKAVQFVPAVPSGPKFY
jgi:hypothetical protein